MIISVMSWSVISQKGNLDYIRPHLQYKFSIKKMFILLLHHIRISECDLHSNTAGGDTTVAGFYDLFKYFSLDASF